MQINTEMTSSRPYLLRALNEWIVDNDLTPHIVVDATHENVVVPTQYIEGNKIVLNISPNAVSNFNISNEYICFSARFSGKAMEIFVPVSAVLALYSKENGQGMVFNEERADSTSTVAPKTAALKTESPKKAEKVLRPKIATSSPVSPQTDSGDMRETNLVSGKKSSGGRPRLKLVD